MADMLAAQFKRCQRLPGTAETRMFRWVLTEDLLLRLRFPSVLLRNQEKKLCPRNHLDSVIPPVLGFLSHWMNQYG
jgi:hypothetical protein